MQIICDSMSFDRTLEHGGHGSQSIVGDTDPEPLSSFILHHQQAVAPEAKGKLNLLLTNIAVACKFVAQAVRKAGVAGVLGLAGASNVQGEQQKKLDVIANDVFVNLLRKSGQCCVLVSEEEEDLIIIDDLYKVRHCQNYPLAVLLVSSSLHRLCFSTHGCDMFLFVPCCTCHHYAHPSCFKYCCHTQGQYAVVFDPLDGSSNIECGVSIGSIFGVYHVEGDCRDSVDDVLQPGRRMVAAGYCMYGSCCSLVLSLGGGVHGFTLDPSLGEFVLTHDNIRVPTSASIYSINEGNAATWNEATRRFVEECKHPPGGGKPKSLRYVGSMVADVHRTLLYGGVFLYPADKKSPNGKLRLLYEVC